MYAVVNSTTKKIKSAYCVVSGVTKKIKAIYGVVGGTTKLVWKSGGDIYSTKGIASGSVINSYSSNSFSIVSRNDTDLTTGEVICSVEGNIFNRLPITGSCIARTYNYLAFLSNTLEEITLFKYNSSTKTYDVMNTVESGVSSVREENSSYNDNIYSSVHISINDDKAIFAFHLIDTTGVHWKFYIAKFDIINDKIIYKGIDELYTSYYDNTTFYSTDGFSNSILESSDDLNVVTCCAAYKYEDGTNATYNSVSSFWAYYTDVNGEYICGDSDSDWSYNGENQSTSMSFSRTHYVTEDGKFIVMWTPGYDFDSFSFYSIGNAGDITYLFTKSFTLQFMQNIIYDKNTQIIRLSRLYYSSSTAENRRLYHYKLSSNSYTNLGSYLPARYTGIFDMTFNNSNASIVWAHTSSNLVTTSGQYFGKYSQDNTGLVTGLSVSSTFLNSSSNSSSCFVNRY